MTLCGLVLSPVTAEFRNMTDNRVPIALTIAGSDSGAGAGIQADIKTFAAHGVYSASVITLVTAQSTSNVDAVHILPADIVSNQLNSVFSDFLITVIKIGAVGDTSVIDAIADFFNNRDCPPVVLDPVMVSKHGAPLLTDDAVLKICERLFPIATLVTPNFFEALRITGSDVTPEITNMELLARLISHKYNTSTLVKGGHLISTATDVLYYNDSVHHFSFPKITSSHTHGTGCTLSSAIAANLYRGHSLVTSIDMAKKYIIAAISNSVIYGRGINPLNHLSFSQYADG